MRSAQHWGIVGGGLLGMTLAWELRNRGERVTLFEAGPAAGGLASSWQLGDIVWDRYYHVTLLSDASLRHLLEQLDLDKEMCWAKTRTGFYSKGQLYPFSSVFDFARFPLLNSIEKLRLAAAIFRASRIRSSAALKQLTVEQWLVGLSGRSVFQKIWRPLLRCKLGDDYSSTSASFIWATIQRLYAARRSGLKEEMFGYLPGGYMRLLETFVCALRKKGVVLEMNASVEQVCSEPGQGTEIHVSGREPQLFDRVVLTVPAPLASTLCPQLSPDETSSLKAVEYHGVICTSLLLRRPLSEFYVTNIVDEAIPLTGVIEMSALVDRNLFHGKSLVYLPRYLRSDDPEFLKPDSAIQSESIAAVRRMHPSLAHDDIVDCRTSRSRHVFPRPTVASSNIPLPIDTTVPGVHILNSANISDGTLNVNESVHLAQTEAKRLYELTV